MTNAVAIGVSAAVLTPRLEDESIDIPALRALIHFLMDKGIDSYAINGATGEFCLTTPEQLEIILNVVNEASDGKAQVICGVGSAGLFGTRQLIRIAEHARVNALLLPMPYFFPYEQQDLEAFCWAVAQNTSLPILLYNLPQFTSGLDSETVERLIRDVPNIIGIKDSSGSLNILRDLMNHKVTATCIVGNDNVFAAALTEEVCHGVISGVACVLPEVISSLYVQRQQPDSQNFAAAAKHLAEFIAQLNLFPTPWGLKWIAEARNIFPARTATPLSQERREAGIQTMAWFRNWLPSVLESIGETNLQE